MRQAGEQGREMGGSTTRKIAHTIGALPLAIVCYLIVSALAEFVWLLLNGRDSWLPAVVPYTLAAIIGAITGMSLAKAACKAWLPEFSRQTIFFAFAGILLAAAAFVAIYLPFETKRIAFYAAVAASGWTAWMVFWKDED